MHGFPSNAPVAQLDRVLGYELRGREFESLRARQIKKDCFISSPFLFVVSGVMMRTLVRLNCREQFRLVVEDSISTRRTLAEFMQDLNYKVFTAKDGVEAVEIMRHHVPNIVLTDLEMPRMNGLELTSYVRSHDETKDVPVIMLTSRTTEKHKQEARSIGVNEYLTKPFVEDILLEKVQYLSSKQ